jgi:hypothetical protein
MRRHWLNWRLGYDSDNDIENIRDRDYLDNFYDEENQEIEFTESIQKSPTFKYELMILSIYSPIENFYIDKSDLPNDFLEEKFDKLSIDNPLDLMQYNIQIFIEQKKSFEKKHEYVTKKKIFNFILDSGGGIFGGSIRDSLIHDFGSRKFYDFLKKYDSNEIHKPEGIYFVNNINLIYSNSMIHSSSFNDRNIIFNDIDSVMDNDIFNKFINLLDNFSLKYNYSKIKDYTKYIDIVDLENKISSYIILNIYIENPNKILNYSLSVIKIDILLCSEEKYMKEVLDKISGNSDFYCNSLRYVNNKISINNEVIEKFLADKIVFYDINIDINIILSTYFHENILFNEISNNIIVLHNIINQIKCKVAVSIDKPDEHRIEKMIYKKWLII